MLSGLFITTFTVCLSLVIFTETSSIDNIIKKFAVFLLVILLGIFVFLTTRTKNEDGINSADSLEPDSSGHVYAIYYQGGVLTKTKQESVADSLNLAYDIYKGGKDEKNNK